MRDTRYLAAAFLLISMLYASCGRQLPEPKPGMAASGEQRKPATPAERELVKKIREVAAVLNSIYHDPSVVAEVNAAIASGFYEDERVLLADLLYPEESALYSFMHERKTEAGEAISWGSFSRKFREAAPEILNPERAAGIIALVKRSEPGLRRMETANENQGLSGTALSIYYPYSEDFPPGQHPLAVPATVEADWVDVADPACGKAHEHRATDCDKIRIDENYVRENPVHIIGSGAEPAAVARENALLSGGQDFSPALIYLGKVKCTRQYDRLISFTGNGGGSELKFIRGEAYITLNNDQQVVNTEFDVISVHFRRKDIRKEREKAVYAIWDPNWDTARVEQVFGIYEADTRGEREFSGAVDTEIEHPGGETTITPVSYSYTVSTQDNIIRQINWARASFFRYNRSGLAGCGLRNGYTWYDCRLPVSYSLPEL